MENNEVLQDHAGISTKQRMIYFVIIPVLFTLLLLMLFTLLLQQGKGKSFSDAILGAGKAAASGAASAVSHAAQLASKPAEPQAPASSSSSAPAAGPSQAAKSGSAAGGGSASAGDTAGTASSAAQQDQPAGPSEFKLKTDEMATQFAKMPPAQASGIISNMSLRDAVFSMIGMKVQRRSDILAKTDPKKAAEIAKALADFPPGDYNDSASAEKKLDSLPSAPSAMDDLVKTYSQMPASSAAILVIELMKTDANKAAGVVAAMDAGTRAQILSSMTDTKANPEGLKYAAALTQRSLK
ncbi:hypothetical protein LJK87_14420 [Paenibacillus sp. P25]|nr:hypothetical protein LJK87_14420 [Paenibacillus sp. P25]